jgi:hypothetical protein
LEQGWGRATPEDVNLSVDLLSPDRGRGWERGLHELSKPPLLASPPSGGEEKSRKEEKMAERPGVACEGFAPRMAARQMTGVVRGAGAVQGS